jgi:folate-dependent phosphoribosylglycinamide formyltransferase PurN
MKKWIVFFSQTGSEIYNLTRLLKRVPDIVITNRQTLDGVNEGLLQVVEDRLCCIPSRPTLEEYFTALQIVAAKPIDALVTMHGYLRIIPKDICDKYEIYNLHPAPLRQHPDLKGKDPQKRIAQTPYKFYGNTIHRCTPELDAGEIILEEHSLNLNYTVEEILTLTHSKATNMWFDFLKERL